MILLLKAYVTLVWGVGQYWYKALDATCLENVRENLDTNKEQIGLK